MNTPITIAKYELIQCLGGGMSQVYRARDKVMGRTVAVKILKEESASNEDAGKRFLLEAQVAGKLAHENVVRIFDFGQDDRGRPYMVMEFLDGQDLRTAMRNGQTGDLSNRIWIAVQVARALEYIHSEGIVHRDIKPENISITNRGCVKLMDFGIARTEDSSITRAGFTVGTPSYMAPEQIRGEKPTSAVDIHAFGVLFFELLTGTKAFDGEGYERIFYQILHQPVDIASLRQTGAPEGVCLLIERCTAKSPAARPESFTAVLEALAPFAPVRSQTATVSATSMGQKTPTPRTIEVPPHPRRGPKKLAIGAGAAAAILIAVIVALMSRSPGTSEQPPPRGSAPPPATIETSTGTMVLIPAGTFVFGSGKEQQRLPDFYIDRTEVSNRAYAEFCRATQRELPADFQAQQPGLPVTNVTYADAAAFASWAGKRLPRSMEWEKAARGPDGRRFPWGESADASKANVAGGPGALAAVDSLATGASPFGLLNTVGNAWEFINDDTPPSQQVIDRFTNAMPQLAPIRSWIRIRGGSYREPLDPNVMWDSGAVPAAYKDPTIGFRCVQDRSH